MGEDGARPARSSPRALANGTQLHSNHFSYQYITKVPGGYVRTFDTGKIEKFTEQGKLARVSDKNGNFIDFTYGKDGHIEKLVDNFNRRMVFSFNRQGKLGSIEGMNGQKASRTSTTPRACWSRPRTARAIHLHSNTITRSPCPT